MAIAMSANTGPRAGRAARALRLLLLVVLALAAVEYLFGSILEASPFKTYLYAPIHNATQPTSRISERVAPSPLPKRLPISSAFIQNPELRNNSNTKFNNLTLTNETYINNTVSSLNVTQNNKTEEIMTPGSVSKFLESLKNVTLDSGGVKRDDKDLPLCDELPSDLGPVPVNKTDMELDEVEQKFPEVGWGGRYIPPNCAARHKVAIIVPFRDRLEHLAVFLNHMHPFLMKQQLEYGIFIVEQDGNQEFNRAKLMNVGFAESMKLKAGNWQCFIFHDIDLLPLDLRNMYSCPRQPRHMSAAVDVLKFRLLYEDLFGGVSAMTLEQFTRVNGFSNKYWGWGGEDDDMSYRIRKMHYHIARYKMSIARYTMLEHKKSSPNPKRYQLLSQTSKTFTKDGLSTLVYEVVKINFHHLYTHILANIDERS